MAISTEEMQQRGETNLEWRAALSILTAPPFATDERVWPYVTGYGIDFRGILEQGTWSSGEAHLLRIANSLFNGYGEPNLDAAFEVLSSEWAELAISAMRIRAGLAHRNTCRVVAAASTTGV